MSSGKTNVRSTRLQLGRAREVPAWWQRHATLTTAVSGWLCRPSRGFASSSPDKPDHEPRGLPFSVRPIGHALILRVPMHPISKESSPEPMAMPSRLLGSPLQRAVDSLDRASHGGLRALSKNTAAKDARSRRERMHVDMGVPVAIWVALFHPAFQLLGQNREHAWEIVARGAHCRDKPSLSLPSH